MNLPDPMPWDPFLERWRRYATHAFHFAEMTLVVAAFTVSAMLTRHPVLIAMSIILWLGMSGFIATLFMKVYDMTAMRAVGPEWAKVVLSLLAVLILVALASIVILSLADAIESIVETQVKQP